MFDLDLWREIFQSIKKNRTRGLLSGFTVAFAIMLFTILFGIANGLENTFKTLFVNKADNIIAIYKATTSKPYKGLQAGREILFNNSDYEFIKKQYKDKVQYISSSLGRNYDVRSKYDKGKYQITGVYPDYQFIERIDMKSGRFLNLNDLNERTKVAVIGRMVEKELFPSESALGKYINLEGIIFRVIGVFTDSEGDNQERQIYISTHIIQQLYTGTDDVRDIKLTYNPNLNFDQALVFGNELTKKLKARHSVAPDDQRAIQVMNLAQASKGIEAMTFGLGILIFIIGFGTLIAGIVGISNIMIFIVKERTKEIGIRKALGAQPNQIVNIILLESVIITAIAGYIGLIIGVGVLKWFGPGLKDYFITDPAVNPSIVLTATIVLILAGSLAGFLPAKKAAKIKPIIALREG